MPQRRHSRSRWITALVAVALIVASAGVTTVVASKIRPAVQQWLDPNRRSLRAYLAAPTRYELRQVYAARDYHPIWIKNGALSVEGAQLVARMKDSAADGLKPDLYHPNALRRRIGRLPTASPEERAALDVDLTSDYAAFIEDLHRPVEGGDFHFTDAALTPYRPTRHEALRDIAGASFTRTAIINATRMNPFYNEYRRALGLYLDGGVRDPAVEQGLRVNLERLRSLPVDMGRRFVFVDVVRERLWLYEGGKAVDSMKVVVGAAADPTPSIAALIRYSIFNPYWNVPPDLTQRHYAAQIAVDPSALDRLEMDAWTDFSDTAHRLEPTNVNWSAAAAGAAVVWLRQRPGPRNAMGAVKFMFPNAFGVYLHDTPNRELFGAEGRAASAGCVRVEDYRRLARWLYRGTYPQINSSNQKVNLPAPIPVYLAYLTTVPMAGRIDLRPDPYDRDRLVVDGLKARELQWTAR